MRVQEGTRQSRQDPERRIVCGPLTIQQVVGKAGQDDRGPAGVSAMPTSLLAASSLLILWSQVCQYRLWFSVALPTSFRLRLG